MSPLAPLVGAKRTSISVVDPTSTLLTPAPVPAWISSQFFSGAGTRVCGRQTLCYVTVRQCLQLVHRLDLAASGFASVDVIAALGLARRRFFLHATQIFLP
jgi:hypothetical protein